MKQRSTLFTCLLAWAAFALATDVRADLATIYLKGGNAKTVELASVDRGQIQWKESVTATDVQITLRSQIDFVSFPTTEVWRTAEDAFQSGNLELAIQSYQRVIGDQASHFYPFPGNFVSLAKERLLRCYRRQMNAEAVAKQAKIVREDFLNLPPEFRVVDPVVEAWTAVSRKEWDKALSVLAEMEAPGPEAFYLRGRALEELGRAPEAVQEYAGVYVLNFGGSVDLTQAALQRSSALLAAMNDKDRQAELKAQVKLYRDLYGKGKLWEGASEELAKLADGEIVALGKAEGEMTKPDSAGGAVAAEVGALATLPSLEERDYILASEIKKRVFVVSKISTAEKPTGGILKGGVTEKEYGYAFDGTGGGIRIGGFDPQAPVVLFRLQFNPAALDGIVVDMNDMNRGGFGVYLKGGEMILTWAPRGGKKESFTIGKAEEAVLQTVFVHVWKDGTMNVEVNGVSQEYTVPAGGLKLTGANQIAAVGYDGEGRKERGTANGQNFIPFKGTVQHFSIGTGGSLVEIQEREVERFGKMVYLTPPKPTEEKVEEKAEEEAGEKEAGEKEAGEKEAEPDEKSDAE